MADDFLSGPGDVPGVDTLAFLANGFFPTHSPRPDSTFAPAVHSAVDRCCDATARDDITASGPRPRSRRRPPGSAAGLTLPQGCRRSPAPSGWPCPRWASGRPCGPSSRSTRRTASTARAAPGPTRTASGTARVLRERREGRGRGGHDAKRIGARVLRRTGRSTRWPRSPTTGSTQQGRLTEPMVLREGAPHYEPISWDDAFDLIGERAARARVAGRGGVLHLRPREQRGGVPVPALRAPVRHQQPARLLEHVPRVERHGADARRIGIGKGTVTLEDFEQADCIFIIGQNPGTNHPRMLTSLEQAKKHGAQDRQRSTRCPRPGFIRFKTRTRTSTRRRSVRATARHGRRSWPTCYLPVRINGDVALFKGLMKEMLDEDAITGGVLDHDFIRDTPTASRSCSPTSRPRRWDDIVDGSGAVARGDRARRAR